MPRLALSQCGRGCHAPIGAFPMWEGLPCPDWRFPNVGGAAMPRLPFSLGRSALASTQATHGVSQAHSGH